MTNLISEAQTILAPFFDHPQEIHYNNTALQKTIEKVNQLLPNLNESNHQDILNRVRHLQTRIDTNNFYVERQKRLDNNFSIHVCTVIENLEGLKYLLRVNENPNELINGKTALHIAASRGLKDFVETLITSPTIDLSIKTKNGKTAFDLAKTEEIRKLLQVA